MPNASLPECPCYTPAPPTQLDLDFADLATIDLSKACTPEGCAELAPQLRDALRTNGFVYAINHGYTQAQRDRVFDIANVPFTAVPPEQTKMYTTDSEKVGHYAGFKQRGYWASDFHFHSTIAEAILVHCDVTKHLHPQALRSFLPELDRFARHNYFNILRPILRLIALSLELPEETLVEKHTFDGQSETLSTYARTEEEEEEKSKNVWIKGHTDIGSVTIIWSQPVGGLQILSPDGEWRWVRHIDNSVFHVTSTGHPYWDMINFLTGGFYKPTIHRVVQPPHDQRACDRLGVFCFAMADDDARLSALAQSPVLQRLGIERQWSELEAPLAGTWRKERTMSYGRIALKRGLEKNTEEEVVQGIVVKHYN
ncbi:hypothetical protein JVT61DRAFT_11757 [Boletus reticuloceps]|uniref:Clavaminate synthase-like protein n=1 Tax=Boletus reticuloceps TaxID=495285 RepID=A0A8I2YX67_9AGAM|nr:hypothetical protein JVT61DRAFT_11757 [Boletus reticuloceps]